MIDRKMIYVLIAVVVCGLVGLGYAGWKMTSRNSYESAEYTVLETAGDIQLREYPDLMLATTNMGDRMQGGDGSFGRLFRYISGNNDGQQKIAMTTPVFMEPKDPDQTADGQMSFVIPKEMAASNIPVPSGQSVRITKRPAGRFAVIQFAGRLDEEVRKTRQSSLENWIEQQGLTAIGEAEVAGYDPPWTPGFLRRNEILIRVE